MRTINDFDVAIEVLDELVAQGFDILHDVIEEENKTAAKKGSRNDKIFNAGTLYTQWALKAADAIKRTTDRKYYYVTLLNNDIDLSAAKNPEASYLVLMSKFTKQLDALKDIVIMLEQRRGLMVRQEIAKQEYDSGNRYWLRYDKVAGKLYLNGNILLAKPHLDSPADKLLQQSFDRPNELIEIEGVTSQQVSSALRDMGITGTLKQIFFPRTARNKVLLRPSVTNGEFLSEGFQDIVMRSSEKQ